MRPVIPSLFGALLIASCDGAAGSYEAKVARGRLVFEAECAACHGLDGNGTAWGVDLRSRLRSDYSFARFSSTVMNGRSRITPEGERKVMPRFADRPVVVRNLEQIYFFLNEETLPSAGK